MAMGIWTSDYTGIRRAPNGISSAVAGSRSQVSGKARKHKNAVGPFNHRSVFGASVLAAAGAAIGVPLTRRWELQTGANVDFSPSMQWPDPVTTHAIEADRDPVLVTVEYRIDSKNRIAFLHALGQNSRERRRDGAYDRGIFEDPTDDGRFIETFLTDSWLEHLRLHRRVTKPIGFRSRLYVVFKSAMGQR